MNSSFEDALLVLRKWKEESALLAIFSGIGNLEIKIVGRVCEMSDKGVVIFTDDAKGELAISLGHCQFEYGDPREMPDISARYGGSRYAAFLSITYPPNEVTLLFEIKPEVATQL